MLFLIRFCDDFRKFLRQVDVFEEGNDTVLEATRAGERRTPPFSIMLSSDIPSISIDLFVFCSSFWKKSRVFFPDFMWFCEILLKKLKLMKIFAIFIGGKRIFLVNPHHWITKKLFSVIFYWKNTRCSKSMRWDVVKICI